MHREQRVASGLGLFAVVYLVGAWRLPRFGLGTAVVDAHIFPLILGAILLLLSLLYFLQAGRLAAGRPMLEGVDRRILLALAISTFVYALLLQRLGYLVATALFLGAAMYILGRRGWSALVAVSVGFAVVTYGLFAYLLNVPLSRGILPF